MNVQDVRWTALALRGGGLLGVAMFGVALALRLVGNVEVAAAVSSAGVLVVIATPAAALLATSVETWRHDRATALLAIGVLLVLAGATLVAIALSG